MTGITTKLRHYGIISSLQIISLICFLVGPLRKLRQDAFQILNAIFTGKHGIVAKVFALGTWVIIIALATKPQAWVIGNRLYDEFVHVQAILLWIGGICWHIAPLDSPLIIVVDAWEETVPTDIILWLCHIVEASIVHDRRGVSVGFHPSFVAHLLYRSSTAGTLVVAQAQGMAYLMGTDKADKLSHQFFIEHLLTCPRIYRSCLNHVPVVYQLHHIMVPTDVAFDNLAATRIVYIRTISIGDG